ncbi:WbqC family protein [Gammaproteobacteria bacterium]|nr:WbqC family protein [Gammaproteobacteria bacterium]
MKISIHQPETYPQLGYFNKIYESEIFVFLDNANYRKNYFQNRNRIQGKDGDIWLTLPVSGGKTILEKKYDVKFISKHIKTIQTVYGAGIVQEILSKLIVDVDRKAAGNLSEFNISFIKGICELLGIGAQFLRSSSLNTASAKSKLVLEICEKTDAHIYLSGISGKEYLDLEEFKKAEIQLWYQIFKYPNYQQKGNGFNKYASVVDCLCLNGVEKTAKFVKTHEWEKA